MIRAVPAADLIIRDPRTTSVGRWALDDCRSLMVATVARKPTFADRCDDARRGVGPTELSLVLPSALPSSSDDSVACGNAATHRRFQARTRWQLAHTASHLSTSRCQCRARDVRTSTRPAVNGERSRRVTGSGGDRSPSECWLQTTSPPQSTHGDEPEIAQRTYDRRRSGEPVARRVDLACPVSAVARNVRWPLTGTLRHEMILAPMFLSRRPAPGSPASVAGRPPLRARRSPGSDVPWPGWRCGSRVHSGRGRP